MLNIFDEEMKSSFLRDKFIEPPFTVLDTKQGTWQDRKRKWKSLGLQSEIGRDVTVINNSFANNKYGRKDFTEISIFDPVLTELMYRWFCPDKGNILDPFAGGSVRGIVANSLGYKYTGIELRQEQIDSNIKQSKNILEKDNQPLWICGDSNRILNTLKEKFDFILSCPPYFDLEIYSDLPDDLSNMDYENFKLQYESIIRKTIKHLKKGCYACFVVSDIRDKKTGFYRDFISFTKHCFINNGALLYNEIILLNSLGTAMLRASRLFQSSKKLCKVHQNVLVFKKT